MRRIFCFILILVFVTSTAFYSNAQDTNYTIKELKEEPSVLQVIGEKIFPNMQRYCDGLMGSHFDAVYLHSNEGLLLYLYELIYEDSDKWLTDDIIMHDGDKEVIFHDTTKERALRIQRLLDDGYVTSDEVSQFPITKEMVANILYRIYSKYIPFKKSVDYTDTENEAVEWAAEIGLPYFNHRSGYSIYPEENINVAEYSTIMTYVYLFLPKAQKDEYNPVNDLFSSSVNENIQKIREEIKKPRLGYWKRDVMQKPELKDLVSKYQKYKKESDLKEIYKKLREIYNLFNYQDDIGYVRYMFTLYK